MHCVLLHRNCEVPSSILCLDTRTGILRHFLSSLQPTERFSTDAVQVSVFKGVWLDAVAYFTALPHHSHRTTQEKHGKPKYWSPA